MALLKLNYLASWLPGLLGCQVILETSCVAPLKLSYMAPSKLSYKALLKLSYMALLGLSCKARLKLSYMAPLKLSYQALLKRSYMALLYPISSAPDLSYVAPFNNGGLDILGPLPIGKGQCKFIVLRVDYFTKWVEAKPLATITEQKVRNFFWHSIICKFGIPRALVSNNGK